MKMFYWSILTSIQLYPLYFGRILNGVGRFTFPSKNVYLGGDLCLFLFLFLYFKTMSNAKKLNMDFETFSV